MRSEGRRQAHGPTDGCVAAQVRLVLPAGVGLAGHAVRRASGLLGLLLLLLLLLLLGILLGAVLVAAVIALGRFRRLRLVGACHLLARFTRVCQTFLSTFFLFSIFYIRSSRDFEF